MLVPLSLESMQMHVRTLSAIRHYEQRKFRYIVHSESLGAPKMPSARIVLLQIDDPVGAVGVHGAAAASWQLQCDLPCALGGGTERKR